jgi:hypothetical protein
MKEVAEDNRTHASVCRGMLVEISLLIALICLLDMASNDAIDSIPFEQPARPSTEWEKA